MKTVSVRGVPLLWDICNAAAIAALGLLVLSVVLTFFYDATPFPELRIMAAIALATRLIFRLVKSSVKHRNVMRIKDGQMFVYQENKIVSFKPEELLSWMVYQENEDWFLQMDTNLDDVKLPLKKLDKSPADIETMINEFLMPGEPQEATLQQNPVPAI